MYALFVTLKKNNIKKNEWEIKEKVLISLLS